MSTEVPTGKIIQICNISTTCQLDQLKSLFAFFGRVDEIQLYPDGDTLTSTVNCKVGYVKFDRADCVPAALNMTNTIFIDKPIIVTQVLEHSIPDEMDSMMYCSPVNSNITLISGGPTWPSTVIHRLVGLYPSSTSYIETSDPELTDRNLPPYPVLPGVLDVVKVEEIRRTVYLSNLDKNVSLDVLHEFLLQIGEIRYIRAAYMDENADVRGAYVEFSEQTSIPKVLSINGFEFFGRPLLVNHATSSVIKPATVRGMKIGRDDTSMTRSRSPSTSTRRDSPKMNSNDHRRGNGHRSSSRSKSHKKSSKSTRSPKRRSRSKKRSRSRSRDHHHRKKDSDGRSHSKNGHHRSDNDRKEKKSRH